MIKRILSKMIKRFINKLKVNQRTDVAELNKFWFTGGGLIKQTSYEQDNVLHNTYDFAQKNTQMESSDNPLRRMRHYSLMKLLRNARINNGIIYLDDYGCTQFPGAKSTIDSFLKEKPDVFFFPMPSGAAFILKNI